MTVSIKAPTSTTGSIQLNGSDVLTIDSSGNLTAPNDVNVTGNVGIGTSSPSYPLHVVTSNAVAGKIQSNRSGGFAYFDIQNTSTTVAGSAAITRLITQNAAGTGTTSTDIYRIATGQFSINNNETNSAAFTSFGVGGTERMRIDSSGRVTMPYQPAFRVGNNTNYSHTGGNPVQFNVDSATAFYNVGGHYNTSTYRFTAPVAGVYSFYSLVIWMSLTSGTIMADSIRLAINGSVYTYGSRRGFYIDGHTGSGGYYTESVCDNLKLNANDYVEVIGQSTQSIHGNQNYTYFTGHLIG